MFRYIFGGFVGGLVGVGTGVAAFGTAFSGIGPGIAVGLLTVKALSGGGGGSQPLTDEGHERVRLAMEEYKRRLEPPLKKAPRMRAAPSVATKRVARRTALSGKTTTQRDAT